MGHRQVDKCNKIISSSFILFLGIGDLIIDLDADIEKSSSSNLDTSLVIPLQGSAGLNTSSRIDSKTQAKECVTPSEGKLSVSKTSSKGKTLKYNCFK